MVSALSSLSSVTLNFWSLIHRGVRTLNGMAFVNHLMPVYATRLDSIHLATHENDLCAWPPARGYQLFFLRQLKNILFF